MTFATWWRGDPLPELAPLPTFSAGPANDMQLIARLSNQPLLVVDIRRGTGDRPYLALMGDTPVAYGWLTTLAGSISDLQFRFELPPRNAYLYDFKTLPHWRGRGIYPRLLQAIIRQNPEIDRFWIGYVPGNDASARGIGKAGFHELSDFVIERGRISGMVLFEHSERARANVDLFQLPVISTPS
ncbi:GNAT family N-acetyltransferase [Dictyobacter aurantiacus]|uniref:N-acetyltransferase domain-containing protein n=1 Tax=Dictyobacter aurantiacus TaxID=1936993 RepID=A0A401ZJY9_9CHLR|nr:GNAT family N-acetyltransferase [Dictyobacter aurantiacus]GCE07148.1 hypothetical protein KDAU_44770 [Dictyobacter aurantiacus]